jgi:proline racemase
LWRNDDDLRRLLNFEPRGHGMMCSVLLMPPISDGADFSIIIMEQDEYVPMCGHCLIGVATTIVASGMKAAIEPLTPLRIDTPAGLIEAEVEVANGRVGAVSFRNVESFVLHDHATIDVPGLGSIDVSVVYGGDFYCFVDGDALGLDLGPHGEARLIETAARIIPAVNQQLPIRHPAARHQPLPDAVHLGEGDGGDVRQTILVPRVPSTAALRHRHQRAGRADAHARGELPQRIPAVRRALGYRHAG